MHINTKRLVGSFEGSGYLGILKKSSPIPSEKPNPTRLARIQILAIWGSCCNQFLLGSETMGHVLMKQISLKCDFWFYKSERCFTVFPCISYCNTFLPWSVAYLIAWENKVIPVKLHWLPFEMCYVNSDMMVVSNVTWHVLHWVQPLWNESFAQLFPTRKVRTCNSPLDFVQIKHN